MVIPAGPQPGSPLPEALASAAPESVATAEAPALPEAPTTGEPGAGGRLGFLAAVAIAASVAVFLQGPIPQPVAFHRFADDRIIFGLPNFWNVASNIVFLIAGAIGLVEYSRTKAALHPALRPAYLTVCVGAILIFFGSSWYHLAPDTPRLTWDRLPITLAFIGMFCVVVGEYLKPAWGRLLLSLLLVAGFAAVAHWHYSEQAGQGDLRFYILVQVIPLLLVPLILLLFRPAPDEQGNPLSAVHLWAVIGIYAVAKALETWDHEVLQATGLSGHTWKHLAAGFALWVFVDAMKRKRGEE